jgi:hypothetical protein
MRLFTSRNAFRVRRVDEVVTSRAAWFVSDSAVSHERLTLAFQNARFSVYRVE